MTDLREKGMVKWFDEAKGFGYVVPQGVRLGDHENHLFLSLAALRRSGLARVEPFDRVSYVRAASRFAGGKDECQQIVLLDEKTGA